MTNLSGKQFSYVFSRWWGHRFDDWPNPTFFFCHKTASFPLPRASRSLGVLYTPWWGLGQTLVVNNFGTFHADRNAFRFFLLVPNVLRGCSWLRDRSFAVLTEFASLLTDLWLRILLTRNLVIEGSGLERCHCCEFLSQTWTQIFAVFDFYHDITPTKHIQINVGLNIRKYIAIAKVQLLVKRIASIIQILLC